jgi:hypothetical protein
MKKYPHYVFVLTDGWTPPLSPQHPERWVWLLPPWGSTKAVPKGSVAEFFATEELRARPIQLRFSAGCLAAAVSYARIRRLKPSVAVAPELE